MQHRPHAITMSVVMALTTLAACKREPAPAPPSSQPSKSAQPAATTSTAPALTLTTGDTVSVVKVIKADEIIVRKKGHPGTATVRLLGIDTLDGHLADPALREINARAKRFTEQHLLGHTATLSLGRTVRDVRGRYLALVDIEAGQLNLILVQEGYVLVYNEYAFKRELPYLMAEQKARAAGKNLWSNQRLAKTAVQLRRTWALARKQRDGSVPDYYLQ